MLASMGVPGAQRVCFAVERPRQFIITLNCKTGFESMAFVAAALVLFRSRMVQREQWDSTSKKSYTQIPPTSTATFNPYHIHHAPHIAVRSNIPVRPRERHFSKSVRGAYHIVRRFERSAGRGVPRL